MVELIINTLEQMIHIQKRLINSSEQKKAALIQRNLDELNQIVQEEARLVKQLGELENQRKEQAETALQAHPFLAFSQLADTLPADSAAEKLRLHIHTLKQLTVELQAKNKVNEQLVRDSLSFVQHMIDQVAHSGQRHFNYQSPLSPQNVLAESRVFFDTKA
jgi:flagellar biosynthesis/type III secretory pathway chaperone